MYWTIKAQSKESAEILIYGQIGEDIWADESVTAKDFANTLRGLGPVSLLNLRINSGGGSVFEGLAIYNLLAAHPARKEVVIDGIAASIASIIAMAGTEITMPENAMMMIHDPSGVAVGTARDMEQMREALTRIAASMAGIYAARTGRTEEEVRQWMADETWMTADECMERGLCTAIIPAVKMAAMAHDFSGFKKVPEGLISHQVSGDGSTDDALAGTRADVAPPEAAIEAKEVAIINRGADVPQVTVMEGVKMPEDRNKEAAEMIAMGEAYKSVPMARQYVEAGKTKAELAEAILTAQASRAQATDGASPGIGMTDKDVRQYSLVRAIRRQVEMREAGKPWDGLEKEVSDEVARITGRQPNGFYVPDDIVKSVRAAVTNVPPEQGGHFVPREVGSMIELLRAKMYTARLGARMLDGLVGDFALPRMTTGATMFWVAEDATFTPGETVFGQVLLQPKRCVTENAYSKTLLNQVAFSVEEMVRADLVTGLAVGVDLAAIAGSGAGANPRGILNTSGIGSITFGGAATWAQIINFETTVATANADLGSLAYLTTPATRGAWKGRLKVAGVSGFLWERGPEPDIGEVNGYRAAATTQVPTNRVIFGNWSDLIIGTWAGTDVVVDPYTFRRLAQIAVTVTRWIDIGVRNPVSFCASSDTGAV